MLAYHGDRKDPSLVNTQYCYIGRCQGWDMSTEGVSGKVKACEVSRRMEEARLGATVSLGWLRVKP